MRQSTGKYINKLSDYLSHSKNITLVCHTNPDGDAIGSLVGLYHYLRSKDKNCRMISPTALPGFLEWLNGTTEICIYEENKQKARDILESSDLQVFLDFNSLSRLGPMAKVFKNYETTRILIDHHPQPDVPADLVISEPKFSSTSELVFDLISHLEKDSFMAPEFIEPIYVGMMTDTGNFSFGTYDGETMRIVGSLLEHGLRKDYITDRVYDNFSADRMRLKGFALAERMVVMENLGVAYIYLSKEDLSKFDYAVGDTEGFVNLPLSISGITISVLFMEKSRHIKLSLRSKGEFSVNELAREFFNGGGHRNAAGGKLEMGLLESIKYFEEIITNRLESK